MQDFKQLGVWKKSHALTLDIYRMTTSFPDNEKFGLVSQMQRSASSVPTNIAEGCGRNGNNELHRFLSIAAGSASELHYQLILAHDLEYIPTDQFMQLEKRVIEVKKMLAGFMKTLKRK
ncbi:MAG: four helix bundle protein [Chloroflexota bacterium]